MSQSETLLPQEPSRADSLGTAYVQGSEIDAECSTFDGTTVEGAGPQALVAAREHLGAVVQELLLLKQKYDDEVKRGSRNELSDLQERAAEASAAIAEPVELDEGPGEDLVEETPVASGDVQELHARLHHMEVDLGVAQDRARRLHAENKVLLDTQSRLEAELRKTRQTLEDTRRRLRHREVDVRQLKGLPLDDIEEPPAEEGGHGVGNVAGRDDSPAKPVSESDALTSPVLNKLAQLGAAGVGKPSASQPKQQLVAALSAAQAKLRQEKERRDKLERKIKKDAERLNHLVALSESQRDELVATKRHSSTVEEYAAECERRLKQCFLRSTHLHAALHGVDDLDSGTPFGARSPSGKMTRNLSAPGLQQPQTPTKLPSVTSKRSH